MAISEQLKMLVEQMPNSTMQKKEDRIGKDETKESIERTVAAIAAGGRENVLGLIEMLAEPGSKQDAKPHFALHCVVNYPLVTRDEKMRHETCEAIASQLGSDKLSAYNRSYLCQELQWAGRDEACAALGKAVLDEGATDAAAMALVAIGGERAAAPLRVAVATATGKIRLNVIDALAKLADAKSEATFIAALGDADEEVRLAAADGLAKAGLPSAAKPLLAAAEAAKGWQRIQLTKFCLVLAEKLAAAGKKPEARQIYEQLKATRTADNERHVRDFAEIGLKAIA